MAVFHHAGLYSEPLPLDAHKGLPGNYTDEDKAPAFAKGYREISANKSEEK